MLVQLNDLTSYCGTVKMYIEKMIKPFNGTGDVSLWLKKVKLVVRTKKSKDLAAIILLFLEDQAYMVFDHMNIVDQKDAGKIEKALLEAFSSLRCFSNQSLVK